MSAPIADFYQSQLRQEEATTVLALRQWKKIDINDLDGSFAKIIDRLVLMVKSGQLGAAKAGAAYVAQAIEAEESGTVNPSAWSGIASDGRPLDTLLYSPIVHTKMLIGNGEKPQDAFAAGQNWLDMITRTQVADASRGAEGVAITVRKQVGYQRYATPPCCQRCAVLDGNIYRWSAGFQRHPRCDCRMDPVFEDQPARRSTIKPDDIKDLTGSQRQAINDGGDMNQVINSHRRGRVSGMTASEGTTRRGLAGQRLAGKARMTPEAIYRVSSDREQAIALLRKHGYII